MLHRSLSCFLGALWLAMPTCIWGQVASEQHVSDVIRTTLQDGDYDAALAAIDAAISADDAPRDYLLYLKGRTFHYLEQYDRAVETFAEFQDQHTDSPWARRTRLAQAMSLARLRGFRQAEELLRREAEYLLSEDRKDEIADIYLEFAKRYFAPADKQSSPDYAKALEFFQQALEVGPRSGKQAEIILYLGQCHQELQQWDAAVAEFQRYVQQHETEPALIEARYRLGTCHLKRGDPVTARREWQDLLRDHAGEDSPLLAAAAFDLALTHGLPEPASFEDLDLGIAALRAFLGRYPDHEQASQAHLLMAQSYLAKDRHDDAARVLTAFLQDARYRERDEVPTARYLLGVCYQRQRNFAQAVATWQDFLAKHPAHDKWTAAQRAIVDTHFYQADEARQNEDYEGARTLWLSFLDKYPLDERGPHILLMLGQMQFAQENWQDAIADWRRLVSKYPQSAEASQAQWLIGQTFEEKLFDFEQAMATYKAMDAGPHAARAQRALQRLTQKAFSIHTDHVFRTDEQPHLTLTSRNLEKLSVRCYRVDLETYFRKMHLARGLERLDISLIDPDETFEFAVPDFTPYQQTRVAVPLPAASADANQPGGVLVVTVSSEKLEATTVVIQSDLDVVIKSSRDEVFVFAQNMRTGQPWPGVRLLVSDGSEMLAEATTGDDGVYHKALPGLATAADVRVFAVSGGHTASNVVGIEGLPVAQGLTPVGAIYTDRSTYRPGQTVRVRGVVRTVANDTYQIEAGKEYSLEIIDTRNRTVWQDTVTLGDFGTFHTFFALPASSALGQYRILVTDKQQQTYQGTFEVLQYRLQNIQLAVDTPRAVYYRGEEIEGTIRLTYYFGSPVVGAEVQYSLTGQRQHTATTNERGEIAFRLPTEEFRETQQLGLTVTVPGRDVSRIQPFVLAAQGFGLNVSTKRPVFLAGETFEVTVQAIDAAGKPVPRDVTVRVLEQTNVHGAVGEVEVSAQEYRTDDSAGRVRITQTLERGGTYIVRAEGTDRFGNPVTGEQVIRVSDDRDSVRLRILADQHTFRAGDETQIAVHWRDDPALALVTYQGARVLGYQLVTLQTGANAIPITMQSELAPNFEFDVTVMTNPAPAGDSATPATDGRVMPGRLHTASTPISVERELIVTLERADGTGDAPLVPGAPVTLRIKTADPQGRPVAAELSLSMVEQALLDRFPRALSSLEELFGGLTRTSSVRTTSSVTFSYQGRTHTINADVLAEAERREVEAAERAAMASPLDAPAAAVAVDDLFASDGLAMGRASGALDARAANSATTQAGQATQQPTSQRRNLGTLGAQLGDRAGQASQQQRAEDFAGAAFGLAPTDATQALENNGTQARTSWEETTKAPWGKGGSAELRIAAVAAGTNQPAAGGGATAWYDTFSKLRAQPATNGMVAVQLDSGVWQYVNTARLDDRAANVLAENWRTENGTVILGSAAGETGYWNPAIVTNEAGEATVDFDMPDRSTSWRLFAQGITRDTLAGEETLDLVTRSQLMGELKLPLAFTDGDQVTLLATVHNRGIREGTVTATLVCRIGEKTMRQEKSLPAADSAASGSTTLEFPLQVELPDGAAQLTDVVADIELVVSAGDATSTNRHSVPVVPYGLPVFATASGTSTGDATAWVALPEDLPTQSPRLQIVIGPSVEQSLLDVLFGPRLACGLFNQQMASVSDTVSSDLMAAVALQRMLRDTRAQATPHSVSVDQYIRSAISRLVAAQNDDGGWSWSHGDSSNRYASARCVWALRLAAEQGYPVPADTDTRAVQYLQQQLTGTAVDHLESKTILLHALAVAGHDDFPLANRLYRNRAALSPSAVLHLALAMHEMDRDPIAAELLASMDASRFQGLPARRGDARSPLPWNHSVVELRALYAVALQQIQPSDARLADQVQWLLEHRTGHRWSPDKATGPAMLAVGHWFAQSQHTNERYKLTVWVNDQRVDQFDISEHSLTATVDVPTGVLRETGRQQIRFELTGRGRYAYQCVLDGFVPADTMRGTTRDWHVRRDYLAAPLQRDGRDVPRGFDVVDGSYQHFQNNMTELPVGSRGHVQLRLWREGVNSSVPEEHLEYLVVTEPLPSGVTVVEDSIRGGFERYEITPGNITFFVGSRRFVDTISYDVFGYLPGAYRAAPTVVRDAYRPDQWATHDAGSLQVLAADQRSSDPYRLSPRELFELGKWNFERQDFAAATEHLDTLLKDWRLRPEIYQHATQMSLDARLEIGPPAEVVRHFEVIKEKWPELTIPYGKILKIGAAYHDMGEYERCYLIFRATLESSFLTESRVAGFLQSQDEPLRSIDYMARLLREYPPEPYVAAATFDLAQAVYALAPQAATHEQLRKQDITRIDLLRRSEQMLDDFLTAYPQDPAADQACFSRATALLEMERYDDTINLCTQAAERYPHSRDLDNFWYTRGYCHFALGQHERALEVCQKVVEMREMNPATGQLVPTDNHFHAIYILGQIYHSLGQAAKAIEKYQQVVDHFADAGEAIQYFTRRDIRVPEVVRETPATDTTPTQLGGETAAVPASQPSITLPLTFRNVSECVIQVYRIDLLKFGLLRRDLEGIAKINLAGIRPHYETTLELGDGKDYDDRERNVALPLEEEGAYLVVCRGDNLHTSGLVLVSSLELDVNEDAVSGRLRATVRDTRANRYLAEVDVRVIGSANDQFTSGETDLRGVFVANGIRGTSTVIAKSGDGQYAFYRGDQFLGPRPENETPQQQQAGEQPAAAQVDGKRQLIEGLMNRNSLIQGDNLKRQQELYFNDAEGVSVEAVK